jgi:hypothetical protein
MGTPLVIEAVGNLLVPLAEYLVSRGADVNRDWGSRMNGSARSMARSHLEGNPQSEKARRLIAVCRAGAAEEILAEMDAKRQSPPPPDERTMRVMQLAADDAGRQGQPAVTTENMLVGLFRAYDGAIAEFFVGTGTDMPGLRATLGERLLPDKDPLGGQVLPADGIAEAAWQVALAKAGARRRRAVDPLLLLYGILSQETGPAARLLDELGTNKVLLSERLRGTF